MIGGLVILTIILIVLAIIIGSSVNQSDINTAARDRQMAERLAPVGQLNVAQATASADGASVASAADSGADGAGGGQDTGGGASASAEPEATEVASGESVYQSACAACHNAGVAGAPAQGDSAAWAERIDKGMETLYRHAIEGFQGSAGVMPAKGGNPTLSDEEVKAAVDFMVEAVE